MTTKPLLYWIRNDLRVSDNEALFMASQSGRPVIPVYIYDTTEGIRPLGAASRWWLHQALEDLEKSFDQLGLRLILRKGEAAQVLEKLLIETEAEAVYWSRSTSPAEITRDSLIKTNLQDKKVEVKSFNGSLLIDPWVLSTKSGSPFQVFTPFWERAKAYLSENPPSTSPSPDQLISYSKSSSLYSEKLSEWALLPTKPNWAKGWKEIWTPTEDSAHALLSDFVSHKIDTYAAARDIPSLNRTSKLSPYLHWGQISPRQVWRVVHQLCPLNDEGPSRFLTELGWREFCHYQLFHNPQMASGPLDTRFENFDWRDSPDDLARWQQGKTGVPLVDAGMRELWQTGWMHNRVRMVVASYLTKDLLINWQEGEQWFWDTLVDANSANNIAGWQWVAGCGADAAPYFRIFNPQVQAERFDHDETYIRRYVPELDTAAYPPPLVDRKKSYKRAMDTYQQMLNSGSPKERLHASCVSFKNKAVLIMGESGSGKSDLSLRLIAMGGELVSDDQVELIRKGQDIIATAPLLIKKLIEARHAGIMKLNQSKSKAKVVLILHPAATEEDLPRLPDPQVQNLMGVSLPTLKLPYLHDSTSATVALILQGKAKLIP